MRCVDPTCPKRSWVLEDHRIAAKSCLLTTRAAKWATVQVGGGRTVSEVAAELACDWHTVNDAVMHLWRGPARGRSQAFEPHQRHRPRRDLLRQAARRGTTPTTPPRWPTWRTTRSSRSSRPANTPMWRAGSTSNPGPGRSGSASAPSTCRPPMPPSTASCCPKRPRWSTPSTSSRWPTAALDAVRRRVQTEQTGHRGRRDDPLYRARRVLLRGEEHLDAAATERLWSLLALGDPGAEVAIAYRVKERLRDFYRTRDPDEAEAMLEELEAHCRRRTMPPEIQRLGRTLAGLVRQDRQLPPGPGLQRPDRSAQQPDQAHQTDRLRVPQLRELPDPRAALRRQAELARARFDRRPVRSQTPPDSEEPKK